MNPTQDAPDDSRPEHGTPGSVARRRGPTTGPVQYKGADLEAERGPGLGCFRIQLVALAIVIVLTPISVSMSWPYEVSAALLFLTILLLLFTGQTIIFLLRLVAAERRGRRRPLAAQTPTVGELEDAGQVGDGQVGDGPLPEAAGTSGTPGDSTAPDGPAGAPPTG